MEANMEEKLKNLKIRLGEISDLVAADALMGWDQQVNMAPGAAEDRGEQLATLESLIHQKATSPEIGKLLDQLEPGMKKMDADSDDVRLVRVARRDFNKRTRVPADFVSEFARIAAVAQNTWEKAKHESNFPIFKPHLEKLVALRRQYADFFKPYQHVYDPLLDDFEPGLKTAEVQEIFNGLRTKQVALIKAIREKPQVESGFLKLNYPEKGQLDFGVKVITAFGYDWNRGRQDKSVHPFTTGFGLNDVRITTRVREDYLNPAMFGTMHECGHALYEQGIDQRFKRSPLAGGASMALHESQSRMWENLVGRSLPFWKHYYPQLQQTFPAQLGNVSLESFYKGINIVESSFIRVEADEATYNLHIMLRLELEIALMEGSLTVSDLPDAWNGRMKEYLGITPANDAEGVLQDVHWSTGSFGYFPTYALGNLVSAQLWEVLRRDLPDLDANTEKGRFEDLLGWLRKNVHQFGAKYEPQELVQKITGSKINPEPYLRYLQDKFGKIYKI
jgi:carboxypeptidase Taq